MVIITVIGWYGTETIGDRAIFAGLLSLFSEKFHDFEIKLGSIYPFFTERTLFEDIDFYRQCSGGIDAIKIFDTQDVKTLDAAIKSSDILVMGGGPLMGIPSMFMIEYAFKKAKALGKKTMILGCGVGPLRKKIYERSLINIIAHSDIAVFRDRTSLSEYHKLSHADKGVPAIDPAVFAANIFSKSDDCISTDSDYAAISIRSFPEEYKINRDINTGEINSRLKDYVIKFQHEAGCRVELIPMHYFEVGGDDRKFMNRLAVELDNPNIIVQNRPLSLQETMSKFSHSKACVGMRFHSVVLQTMLCGNNIILDYTDPENGKIGNFIRQIHAENFYRESYVNLQTEVSNSISFPVNKMSFPISLLDNYRKSFIDAMDISI